MVTAMDTFNVDVAVGNLGDPARNQRVSVMVDTGATYATLPQEIVEDPWLPADRIATGGSGGRT